MNNYFVVVLALAASAAPASASPSSGTWAPAAAAAVFQAQSTPGLGPQATGSLPSDSRVKLDARDVLGRDMRSSTRGNAQFPERAPEAQNLGDTSGGPQY
ncbi:hypothetical protein JCM2811A_51460 [Methylorubrum rhodinum]